MQVFSHRKFAHPKYCQYLAGNQSQQLLLLPCSKLDSSLRLSRSQTRDLYFFLELALPSLLLANDFHKS